jgi:RNA polymerase sigma-70 factor (ECF subfamily)
MSSLASAFMRVCIYWVALSFVGPGSCCRLLDATMDTPLSLLDRLENPADDSAWRRFDALYRPWIERWVQRLDPGLSANDTDDVIQEVMKALFQKVSSFRRERAGAFRNWLRAIIAFRLKEFWRARKRRPVPLGPTGRSWLDEIAEPDSQLTQQWNQEHDQYVLQRLIDLLSAEFSAERMEAFRRTVLEGQAADVVAAALHKSKNAVLLDKSRVLSRLREEAEGLIE